MQSSYNALCSIQPCAHRYCPLALLDRRGCRNETMNRDVRNPRLFIVLLTTQSCMKQLVLHTDVLQHVAASININTAIKNKFTFVDLV